MNKINANTWNIVPTKISRNQMILLSRKGEKLKDHPKLKWMIPWTIFLLTHVIFTHAGFDFRFFGMKVMLVDFCHWNRVGALDILVICQLSLLSFGWRRHMPFLHSSWKWLIILFRVILELYSQAHGYIQQKCHQEKLQKLYIQTSTLYLQWEEVLSSQRLEDAISQVGFRQNEEEQDFPDRHRWKTAGWLLRVRSTLATNN